jgi:probable addiction module antidote protein
MRGRRASAYLNTVLRTGDRGSFLTALRKVVELSGGMSRLARMSNLSRESLYRMLSEYGNPEIKSLSALLKAMGLRICVTPLGKAKS